MPLRNPFARPPRPRPVLRTEKQRDDRPKAGLFAEPVRVDALTVLEPEVNDDGSHRVTYQVEVRDAEGRRCSELSVEARLTGPHTTKVLQGATDLFGRIRFRMDGPPGGYSVTITDVAAFGLVWDADAGPTTVSTTV